MAPRPVTSAVYSIAALSMLLIDTASACDPQTGASTLRGEIHVSARPNCIDTPNCPSTGLSITGSGLPPNVTLAFSVPARPPAIPVDVHLTTGATDRNGRVDVYASVTCRDVGAAASEAPGQVMLVADEGTARRAFAFVASSVLVCPPPRDEPCDAGLCTTLSVDSASTIGVHWRNTGGWDRVNIRYAPVASDTWIDPDMDFTTDDVSDVALNNLVPATEYEVEVLACHTNFASPSDCSGWLPVGRATTKAR